MKIKTVLLEFGITFLLILVVASIVTFLWNAIFHQAGSVDWETSFRLAIIFGIVLPWIKSRS